jgi:hypothetical protein
MEESSCTHIDEVVFKRVVKRVVCSSCELLSSLDYARGSVLSSALPHCEEHQQAPSVLTFRDVLLKIH